VMVFVGSLLLNTGACAAEDDVTEVNDSAEPGAQETPYYGCFVTDEWSPYTQNDCTWKFSAKYKSAGGRQQKIRERDCSSDHNFSVISATTDLVGDKTASGWRVDLDCGGGGEITNWRELVCLQDGDMPDGCFPGCAGLLKARLQVRAADCGWH